MYADNTLLCNNVNINVTHNLLRYELSKHMAGVNKLVLNVSKTILVCIFSLWFTQLMHMLFVHKLHVNINENSFELITNFLIILCLSLISTWN